MMRLLQMCNVGEIRGGTAACAWSVTRALPDFQHEVLALTEPSAETVRVFSPVAIRRPASKLEAAIATSRADLVLLHNVSRRQLPREPEQPTLNSLHSKIDPAPATRRVVCSDFLNQLYGGRERVLWQGVPRAKHPLEIASGKRELRTGLVVGRLCTPTGRKWWPGLPEFYERLAGELPEVRWEFVGCPEGMQARLAMACGGRARFYSAAWSVREKFWEWDVLLYHHPTLPETFGRTVAEACRAGCIPVVDRRGGFIEQMAEGGGILCDGPDDFLEALRRLLDPGERWKRSRSCRNRAEELFSLGAFRERLLEEFRALIAGSSSKRAGQAAVRCEVGPKS